jgi:hypothetical protein
MVHQARGDATSAFERRLAGLTPDALQQINTALVALEAALAAGAQGARAAGQPRGPGLVKPSQQAGSVARTAARPVTASKSHRALTAPPPSPISTLAPADAATAAEQGATV